MFYEWTKYIDVKLYFIRDVVTDGKVCVVKIPTALNLVDMLTKIVPLRKFKLCLDLIKIRERWAKESKVHRGHMSWMFVLLYESSGDL